MRFYLISDNVDTQVGLRLAGIDGVVVHETAEVQKVLKEAMAMEDVAVILITENLLSLCPDLIYDLKLNQKRPLILEIPDRHGNGRTKDSITRYVREAIGLKI
ncbi:V-type ATP synthase subunit F [Caproiciproducens sp. R1]|jgi:Archaeal/vacuolar-type H+-ATPase subunit F|uniref:V-type ATP synthase subunit F n=1 Tax=Caproiciproducens sp. R1 TaxID=3435000 RepID=UPI000570A346|nr:ATP synthase subunit F [Oscillospiraceae bacterium]